VRFIFVLDLLIGNNSIYFQVLCDKDPFLFLLNQFTIRNPLFTMLSTICVFYCVISPLVDKNTDL